MRHIYLARDGQKGNYAEACYRTNERSRPAGKKRSRKGMAGEEQRQGKRVQPPLLGKQGGEGSAEW